MSEVVLVGEEPPENCCAACVAAEGCGGFELIDGNCHMKGNLGKLTRWELPHCDQSRLQLKTPDQVRKPNLLREASPNASRFLRRYTLLHALPKPLWLVVKVVIAGSDCALLKTWLRQLVHYGRSVHRMHGFKKPELSCTVQC